MNMIRETSGEAWVFIGSEEKSYLINRNTFFEWLDSGRIHSCPYNHGAKECVDSVFNAVANKWRRLDNNIHDGLIDVLFATVSDKAKSIEEYLDVWCPEEKLKYIKDPKLAENWFIKFSEEFIKFSEEFVKIRDLICPKDNMRLIEKLLEVHNRANQAYIDWK